MIKGTLKGTLYIEVEELSIRLMILESEAL